MSHFDRALSFGPMEADLREARSKARLDWLCVGLQTAKCLDTRHRNFAMVASERAGVYS